MYVYIQSYSIGQCNEEIIGFKTKLKLSKKFCYIVDDWAIWCIALAFSNSMKIIMILIINN